MKLCCCFWSDDHAQLSLTNSPFSLYCHFIIIYSLFSNSPFFLVSIFVHYKRCCKVFFYVERRIVWKEVHKWRKAPTHPNLLSLFDQSKPTHQSGLSRYIRTVQTSFQRVRNPRYESSISFQSKVFQDGGRKGNFDLSLFTLLL